MDLPRRREGEPDDAYLTRLRRLDVPPGWDGWFRGIILPRAEAWQAGPQSPATADQRAELTPKEQDMLAEVRAELRKAQLEYDQVTTTKGVAYWRTSQQQTPEEAERQFREESARRGLTAQEIDAEVQRSRDNAAKVQSTVVSAAGTAAGLAALIPVAGWVVSAAIALSIALSQLILRLVGNPERTPAQWREWQERVKRQVKEHLQRRQEGIDTYRGFTADGPELEDDPMLALQQLVNRRLFILSLASGVDWAALFPVLPFGTVVPDPYLLNGIPEVSEMEAAALDEARHKRGPQTPFIEEPDPDRGITMSVTPFDFQRSPFKRGA